MSLGPASAGTTKPISVSTSTLSGVAIATWAAATPSMPCTVRLTWSSVTESAYAPRRSSTCRCSGLVMRPLCQVPVVAPSSRPRPDEWPTVASDAARASSSGVPRAATNAANSGITSPCSAQSSSVAESSVVRSRCARTCSSTSGVAMPAARCRASQPHSTSSPYGVSPSPRPTSAATSTGSGGPDTASRGTWTSTRRPTVTGSSSRCSTPSTTSARDTSGSVSSEVRTAQGTAVARVPTTPTHQLPTPT